MRYRTLDANGDYTFGQNGANFLVNSAAAVGQAVLTRLKLIAGEWFLDNTAGTPYNTDILGAGTGSTRDLAVQAVILETQGVNEILEYASYLNPATRLFTVAATIDTIYGVTTITTGI
ncbi:hypothetical protein NDK50_07865 [Paraburkholderia bryophila]|uniref:hypothetical protein n=1 Tax=Paraburkholderia bryophila TaxID=420952 RepID=UPI00234AECE0|nr:hypothetical protein [Paraburkholderia bryophila]WCM21352.1 hypothetical protein NDK50_07865 [Paraburkholderia bryophila]